MRRFSLRFFFLLLSVAVFIMPCSSKAFYRLDLSVQGGYNIAIPKADYLKSYGSGVNKVTLPKVRSQAALNIDLDVIGFSFDRFLFNIGGSFNLVSNSNIKNSTLLRKYSAWGINAYIQYDVSWLVGIGLRGRMLFCRYNPLTDRFLSFDAEPYALFRIVNKETFEFAAVVPVTISFRKDIISVRPSVAAKISLKVGLKENEN